MDNEYMKNQRSESRKRKGENPERFTLTQQPSKRKCNNPACQAVFSVSDTFCKRCTCYICHSYDDNKDQTLWFECSCGLSCHIECALEHIKAGVANVYPMKLDVNYWCGSCSHKSEILGCLKKQLTVAKGCQRVEILCYRILLCFMLLDGTRRFQDLHKIVKEAKDKLETEVGPLARVSPQQARGIVSGLSIAGEVQALCLSAIKKADELQARGKGPDMSGLGQTVNPDTPIADGPQLTSRGLDLNTATIPDPDAGAAPVYDSSRIVTDNGGAGSTATLSNLNVDAAPPVHNEGDNQSGGLENRAQPGPDVEVEDMAVRAEAPRERAHDGDNDEGAGHVEQNFERCVRVIRRLECEKYITPEFRLKLLTWFGFRANERECTAVSAYIHVFMDEPRRLADQLMDSFAHILHG